MAEKKEQRTAEAEVYEQHEDESGRIRLDRKLTPEEAAAQDEANRRAYLEERRRRFASGARPRAAQP